MRMKSSKLLRNASSKSQDSPQNKPFQTVNELDKASSSDDEFESLSEKRYERTNTNQRLSLPN